MKILIKSGNAIIGDKTNKVDILIQDDIIIKIEKDIKDNVDRIINAEGKYILPGLVDMHTHLREPGYEHKETIMSGTRAAVVGGFTSIACMPNTNPVCDNSSIVEFIKFKAKEAGYAKVYPIGAITKGSKGEELAEMYNMKKSGIVAASDDGHPVERANIMRNALEYAKSIDLLLISHCEDMSLTGNGLVNEGYHSTISGLQGITRVSEEMIVSREILLAEALNTRVHIAHISTRGSVQLVRDAKLRGVKVTAETCPHYFSATDEMILSFDTNTKVNPPLREEEDKQAIIQGLVDGSIDAIVTDHAPHHKDDKRLEYALAANGISGLETSFSLGYTNLVKAGYITLERLVELMSYNPSKILGLNSGLCKGNKADITVVDIDKKYIIDSNKFLSQGKNTPFNGFEVYGVVEYTIVDGRIVWEQGK